MSLIAVFCTVLSFGQNTQAPIYLDVRPTYETNTENEQASILKADKSAQVTQQMVYRDYSTGECAKYHKMKIAGIVLCAVGGGMIMTGAIIMGAEGRTYLNDDPYRNGYTPMRAGGGALVGLGIVSAGVGIPLAIVGSVKGRRYCGAAGIPSQSYLELSNTNYGYGLALKF